MEKPEISVKQFAEIYLKEGKRVFNYSGQINYATSDDKDYLVDNPNRRCPDLSKARKILSYNPQVSVSDGVRRFLQFVKNNNRNIL